MRGDLISYLIIEFCVPFQRRLADMCMKDRGSFFVFLVSLLLCGEEKPIGFQIRSV